MGGMMQRIGQPPFGIPSLKLLPSPIGFGAASREPIPTHMPSLGSLSAKKQRKKSETLTEAKRASGLLPGRQTNSGDYKYGFNGKENDNEVKGMGNQQDYGFRIYDPRLGKFLSVDPLTKEYPWNTPFSFAENDPINNIDLDGLERYRINPVEGGGFVEINPEDPFGLNGLVQYGKNGPIENSFYQPEEEEAARKLEAFRDHPNFSNIAGIKFRYKIESSTLDPNISEKKPNEKIKSPNSLVHKFEGATGFVMALTDPSSWVPGDNGWNSEKFMGGKRVMSPNGSFIKGFGVGEILDKAINDINGRPGIKEINITGTIHPCKDCPFTEGGVETVRKNIQKNLKDYLLSQGLKNTEIKINTSIKFDPNPGNTTIEISTK